MFERYTEKARGTIRLAHTEAVRHFSPYVETQHLLLAIISTSPGILTPFLPDEGALESIVGKLREIGELPKRSSSSSAHIPLSLESKRVLSHAAEDAESLGHRHIGTEHLLLGLLREENAASRLLGVHGMSRDQICQDLITHPPNSPPASKGNTSRADLHKLIDTLPEEALDAAARALQHLQVLRSARSEVPARIAELQRRMEDVRTRSNPGSRGAGGGTSSFGCGADGRVQSGHFSFNLSEEGAMIFETHRFHQGHEITLLERLRLSDDGKQMAYSLDIEGPKQERKIEMTFDLS